MNAESIEEMVKRSEQVKKNLIRQGMTNSTAMNGLNMVATNRPAGEAAFQFLESGLTGLQLEEVFHQRSNLILQQILRIVLLDPDKVASFAQSGRALEALHKPLVEHVNEIRPYIKKGVCSMLENISYLLQKYKNVYNFNFNIFDYTKKWGEIFADTHDDISKSVSSTMMAVQGKTLSKSSATKHIGKFFGVKNTEEELKIIDRETQKEIEEQMLQQPPPGGV